MKCLGRGWGDGPRGQGWHGSWVGGLRSQGRSAPVQLACVSLSPPSSPFLPPVTLQSTPLLILSLVILTAHPLCILPSSPILSLLLSLSLILLFLSLHPRALIQIQPPLYTFSQSDSESLLAVLDLCLCELFFFFFFCLAFFFSLFFFFSLALFFLCL